jgi:hypothetical protein
VSAAECSFSNRTTIYVSNQTDIDTRFKDCTTFPGAIGIEPDYQGIFNLSGFTNVTGIFTVGDFTGGLTSIVLDDLTYVDNLELTGMNAVNSISLPKLVNATNIGFQAYNSTKVSCLALVNSVAVYFDGNISR